MDAESGCRAWAAAPVALAIFGVTLVPSAGQVQCCGSSPKAQRKVFE
jgi:hypothetical protein